MGYWIYKELIRSEWGGGLSGVVLFKCYCPSDWLPNFLLHWDDHRFNYKAGQRITQGQEIQGSERQLRILSFLVKGN